MYKNIPLENIIYKNQKIGCWYKSHKKKFKMNLSKKLNINNESIIENKSSIDIIFMYNEFIQNIYIKNDLLKYIENNKISETINIVKQENNNLLDIKKFDKKYSNDIYYLCARCLHITNQKIEMKRHLEKKKKCIIKINDNKLSDEELYNISLKKHRKFKNKIINKNDHTCHKCYKKFSNKGNLNKHLKIVCNNEIKNTKNNSENICIENIININVKNPLKDYDLEFYTDIINNQKRKILLNNLKNYKINLNVDVDNFQKKIYDQNTKKDIEGY